jgi:hypothetical protein
MAAPSDARDNDAAREGRSAVTIIGASNSDATSRRTQLQVKLGIRHLTLGAEHRALKVGEWWYEVRGTGKEHAGPNEIDRHRDDARYAIISPHGVVDGDPAAVDAQITAFAAAWIAAHPTYAWNGDNCQLFVNDLLAQLGLSPVATQNQAIGGALVGGGLAVGLLSLALGLFIGGKHLRL